MKVVRNGEAPEAAANSPLFVGVAHASRLVTAEDSAQVTVSLVRFTSGGRNRFHVHGADQVLYITEGRGIVADSEHEHHVTAGDIVHVPAGERHWHGAEEGHDMAHLSILPPCETKVAE